MIYSPLPIFPLFLFLREREIYLSEIIGKLIPLFPLLAKSGKGKCKYLKLYIYQFPFFPPLKGDIKPGN